MNNVSIASARKVAIFFASACFATVGLAAASPVFASDEQPVQASSVEFSITPPPATLPVQAAPANAVVSQVRGTQATSAAPEKAAAPVDPVAKARADKAKAFGPKKLKPGTFVWNNDAKEVDGPPKVVVSISEQQAYVYRGDTLVAVTTVSTGKPGHRTPTGTFRITEKRAVHFSSKYNNAPMPHMQRLTDYGIALHAGHIPGRPASHGCVRLPAQFAADLFKVTKVGTTVVIRG